MPCIALLPPVVIGLAAGSGAHHGACRSRAHGADFATLVSTTIGHEVPPGGRRPCCLLAAALPIIEQALPGCLSRSAVRAPGGRDLLHCGEQDVDQ